MSRDIPPWRVHLFSSIDSIVEGMREPAFVVDVLRGVVVHANQRARRAFSEVPLWLCTNGDHGARPRWVRSIRLDLTQGIYDLLLIDCLEVDFEHAPFAAWATEWRLAPRHARVACGLLHALADKEIAQELGLEPNTVRTYVRHVFEAAGVNSRGALIRAALGASVRKEATRASNGE